MVSFAAFTAFCGELPDAYAWPDRTGWIAIARLPQLGHVRQVRTLSMLCIDWYCLSRSGSVGWYDSRS